MAIEFTCPHCAGVMRAPDQAIGRKAPCPGCGGTVEVPAPPARAIEFGCPSCGSTIRVRGSAAGTTGTCPGCGARLRVPDPDRDARNTPIDLALDAEDADQPVRAVLRKRRRARFSTLLLPLGLVLLLACGGLYLLWRPDPPFVGKLTAERVKPTELGPFPIDREFFTMSGPKFAAIVEHLSANPLWARSRLLRVEFQGTAGSSGGIGIAIHTGDDTEFIRIDPAEDKRLEAWIVKHVTAFDDERRESLAASVPEFLKALDRRREGGDIDGLLEFRNNVGLAASVRGFGYVVLLKHRGTAYPCIHEDQQGRLYFAVPIGARESELVGKEPPPSARRDTTVFTGRYQVNAAGGARRAAPRDRPPANQPEASAETDAEQPEDSAPEN